MYDFLFNPLKDNTIKFLLFPNPTELKNIFVLKEMNLICWGTIKVKILYKVSGMKFSSPE